MNYVYIILFDWRVSWLETGGVSDGAPIFIKFAKDIIFICILVAWLVLLSQNPILKLRLTLSDMIMITLLLYQTIMLLPAISQIGFLSGSIAFWQNSGYLLIYFLVRIMVSYSSPIQITNWLSHLLIIGGFVSSIGIWQFVYSTSIFQYVSGSYVGLNRAFSTLGNPNALGFFLSFLLLISLALSLYRKNIYLLIATGLITICLVMTVSMTSILGTILGVCIFIIIQGRKKKYIMGISGLLGSAIVLLWAIPSISQRILNILVGQDESLLIRLEHWAEIFPSDFISVLFGSGGGTGGAITVSFSNYMAVADNQYLALIIQYGVIGLGLYLAVIALSIKSAFSPSNIQSLEVKNLRIAGGLVLVAVLFFCITSNVLNMFPINLYIWAILALTVTINSKYRSHNYKLKKRLKEPAAMAKSNILASSTNIISPL